MPHSRSMRGTNAEASSKVDRVMAFCADIPIEAILDDSVDASLDVPLPAPWDDVPTAASGDDNMEAVAAEPQQPTEAVAVSSPGETSAEMEEEANKKGYGKAYAAFGGGRDGLEACAASKSLLSQIHPHVSSSDLMSHLSYLTMCGCVKLVITQATQCMRTSKLAKAHSQAVIYRVPLPQLPLTIRLHCTRAVYAHVTSACPGIGQLAVIVGVRLCQLPSC